VILQIERRVRAMSVFGHPSILVERAEADRLKAVGLDLED